MSLTTIDVEGYLSSKGTWKRSGDELIGYCPACNGTSERSLSVNATTGQWICNRQNNCGQSGNLRALQDLYGDKPATRGTPVVPQLERTYVDPKHAATALKSNGRAWLNARGLDDLTIGAWRVGQERAYYRKADGEADGLAWPVYDDKRKLVNLKGRCLKIKDFVNKKGCAQWPVGIHLVDVALCGKRLILVEGEIDAMSGHHYGLRNIVSLPNGAGDQKWIDLAWDWLGQFETIVLCLDADKAGREALAAILNRLRFQWDIRVATLPNGHKDLNECLVSGVTKAAITEAIDGAIEHKPARVMEPSEFRHKFHERWKNRHGMSGWLSGIRTLDLKTHGFRAGELSIWTGQSGSGKSTVLAQILVNAVQLGQRSCVSSIEIPPYAYLVWLGMQAAGMASYKATVADDVLNWLSTGLTMINTIGVVTLEDLLEDWAYCAQRKGCQQFVADPMQNIRADGRDENTSQRAIIQALIGFAHQYGVHVHLVAHPRKVNTDTQELGQNDVSGSKSVTDLAHNIFVIRRTPEQTFITVKKVRDYGSEGHVAIVVDPDNKQVYELAGGKPNFWAWIDALKDPDISDAALDWSKPWSEQV